MSDYVSVRYDFYFSEALTYQLAKIMSNSVSLFVVGESGEIYITGGTPIQVREQVLIEGTRSNEILRERIG